MNSLKKLSTSSYYRGETCLFFHELEGKYDSLNRTNNLPMT